MFAVKVAVKDALIACPVDAENPRVQIRRLYKLAGGLQADRVWLQGVVRKVQPKAAAFWLASEPSVSERGATTSTTSGLAGCIKVNCKTLPGERLTYPQVGQYVRVVGRLTTITSSKPTPAPTPGPTPALGPELTPVTPHTTHHVPPPTSQDDTTGATCSTVGRAHDPCASGVTSQGSDRDTQPLGGNGPAAVSSASQGRTAAEGEASIMPPAAASNTVLKASTAVSAPAKASTRSVTAHKVDVLPHPELCAQLWQRELQHLHTRVYPLMVARQHLLAQQKRDLSTAPHSTPPVVGGTGPACSPLPFQQQRTLPRQQHGTLPCQQQGSVPCQQQGSVPCQQQGTLPFQAAAPHVTAYIPPGSTLTLKAEPLDLGHGVGVRAGVCEGSTQQAGAGGHAMEWEGADVAPDRETAVAGVAAVFSEQPGIKQEQTQGGQPSHPGGAVKVEGLGRGRKSLLGGLLKRPSPEPEQAADAGVWGILNVKP